MKYKGVDRPAAVFNAADAAAELGVHIHTFKRMIQRGELDFWRIGSRGDVRVSRTELERYKREGPRGPHLV